MSHTPAHRLPGKLAPWAVAAGLAAAAIWLGARNLSLQGENAALRIERDLAEVAERSMRNRLAERTMLAEGMITSLGRKLQRSGDLSRLQISALTSHSEDTKEAQVIVVWDAAGQTGLMSIDKLPSIADTQDYQIWIFDPAYQDPVNGGLFRVGPDGKATVAFTPDRPVQAADFAISLEKKGGAAKAEGPWVMHGNQGELSQEPGWL